MDAFLFSMLPNVVRLSSEQVPWHYNAACADCQWKEGCLQRTQEGRTVSMIPDLSTENADFLREVIKLEAHGGLPDIEELGLVVNERLYGLQLGFPATAARFRNLMGMKRRQIGYSPVLDAVRKDSPQVHVPLALSNFSFSENRRSIFPKERIIQSLSPSWSIQRLCPQNRLFRLLISPFSSADD